jgi:hypothetical protein
MSVKKLTHPSSQTGRERPKREERLGSVEFIEDNGRALE